MGNYKLGSGLILLDKHEATGTESSYTFTPSTPLLPSSYSKILVQIQMEPTAAFILQAVINAVSTATQSTRGISITASALVHVTLTTQAQIQLASAAIAATDSFVNGNLELQVTDITENIVSVKSDFGSDFSLREICHSQVVGTHGSITSIKIQASTSTWKVGTRITTYGVLI